ncbi:MAG: DUF3892 domain-containing protein [Bacteriovoracia bacterium]
MFVKAKQTGKRQVTYWNEDGSTVIHTGGNWTWRNQNPGNIGAGAWANRHGAIGQAGGFAVFPSYEIGAILSLLKGPDYFNLSIWDAIPKYAPAKENDVAWYRRIVKQATRLDLKRKIKDLSQKELESLVNAIERAEGKFKPGKVTSDIQKKKITAVRKNKKGIIFKYYIEGLGWLSKKEAIQLTADGKIDAVIASSRSGSIYLRTRPDKDANKNLENLG